jgi:hypothetical protein
VVPSECGWHMNTGTMWVEQDAGCEGAFEWAIVKLGVLLESISNKCEALGSLKGQRSGDFRQTTSPSPLIDKRKPFRNMACISTNYSANIFEAQNFEYFCQISWLHRSFGQNNPPQVYHERAKWGLQPFHDRLVEDCSIKKEHCNNPVADIVPNAM